MATEIELPKFTEWSPRTLYDYQTHIVDYETLEDLGKAINSARVALFKVTEKINQYEREEREAKMRYDREYRRAYLASTERTEAMKKLRAELSCEEFENKYVYAEQLKNELNRVSNTLRLELQTLQAIGNNLRQQMKME